MLSAFVSRKSGFGRVLSAADLIRVNAACRGIDKSDIGIQAAKEILKSTHSDPIIVFKSLYIGANNVGYWNGYHMS